MALRDSLDLPAKFPRPAHRPEINDLGPLFAMACMRIAGHAPGDLAAARVAADTILPTHYSKDATVHRLRRKMTERSAKVSFQLAFIFALANAFLKHKSLFAQVGDLPMEATILIVLDRADAAHPEVNPNQPAWGNVRMSG